MVKIKKRVNKFLKPTKEKIILTIILFIFAINLPTLLFKLVFYIPYILDRLLYLIFGLPGIIFFYLDIYLNIPKPPLLVIYLSILIWNYFLSCLIIYIYKKIKK